VIDALPVQGQLDLIVGSNGIEITDTLDVAASPPADMVDQLAIPRDRRCIQPEQPIVAFPYNPPGRAN